MRNYDDDDDDAHVCVIVNLGQEPGSVRGGTHYHLVCVGVE